MRPDTSSSAASGSTPSAEPSPAVNRLFGGFLGHRGETVRQTGMLFSAQSASLFGGLCASLIQARWMEPAEVGRFAFCVSVIVVSSLFFEFGIPSAGARVLALERDSESERRALGALVLLTLLQSAVFAIFILMAAIPIDRIFQKDTRWLLISTAALVFFQPFQQLVEKSCQGLNRIRRLSEMQVLTSGIYLMMLVVFLAAHRLNAATVLASYLGGIAIASTWTLFQLKPAFTGTSVFIKRALNEMRSYGLNMQVARIAGMASTRADQLVIAYFMATAPVGMYAIVQKFSNPILMLARSLATTRFRVFARSDSVSRRITVWNTAVLATSAVGLAILGPIAIKTLFPKYGEAAWLLFPFALTQAFNGLFQPYNVFLASQGKGRELRNIVLVVGVVNVIGLVFAVPAFGLAGAAWVGVGSMALDYLLHVSYYRVFKRSNIQTSAPNGD
jgi:O-antigen/teichoic acid export membrane protein